MASMVLYKLGIRQPQHGEAELYGKRTEGSIELGRLL